MGQIQYRIAIVGEISEQQESLRHKLSARLMEIQGCLQQLGTEEYEYSACFLTAAEELSGVWKTIREENQIKTIYLPMAENPAKNKGNLMNGDRHVLARISDMADLVLGFWNEDTVGEEAYICQIFYYCMEKGVPCLWISKKDEREYWGESILFEPFQDDILKKYLSSMLRGKKEETVKDGLLWGNRLIEWGGKSYRKMLKKFAPMPSDESVWVDHMMDETTVLPDYTGETLRTTFLKKYQRYDRRAVELAQRYRGSIYWRSVLPLAATVLLSIGFYGDAVSKAVSSILLGKEIVPVPVFQLMSYAFFLHGMMTLFSHLLAKSKTIQNWHTGFLYHRMMAEILRFYIHVIPFGITMPLKEVLSKSGYDLESNRQVYIKIWHILHENQVEMPAYQPENASEFLHVMKDYLHEQVSYHKRSVDRYQKLWLRLHKLESCLMAVGIATVILRGVAQFFIIGVNSRLIIFAPGVVLPGYVGSLANMIAMVIPAAAAYYTGKLTLFGFEDNIAIDQLMLKRLEKAIKLVGSIEERELDYAMLHSLAQQLGVLLMGEVAGWNQEMAKRKIKGL